MKLKNRLGLVVALFMSAFVVSYSLLTLLEVPERANAETEGAMPWVISLLPDHVDEALAPGEPQLRGLTALVEGLREVRHIHIALRSPDGQLLAATPQEDRPVPGWLTARLSPPGPPVRKEVTDGQRLVAYFEVSPATSDELAELWEDYLRSTALVVALSLISMGMIVWGAFHALKPLDRIRDALRAMAAGHQEARLPAFGSPEMNEIAMSFNRMADVQEASTLERQALLRKLIDSDENTRRSVAHDLHDELSPYLVALQPLVRTLQMKCAGRPELAELAGTVDTLVSHQSHILATLRDILMGLHPPELETYGLRGAIERLLAQSLPTDRGTTLQVVFEPGGNWQSFGVTLDISIYRLVQECLTNARRHASGTRVEVRFDPCLQSDGRTHLGIDVVNDSEPGAPQPGMGGLGVPGMRDRCLALGGTFHAGPHRTSQWRVSIRLPLDPCSPSPTQT